jgi:hypothetical protein
MSDKQQHFDVCRRWQEYFDTALAPIGMKAPVPVLGDSVDSYRRETYRALKNSYLPPVHPLYKPQHRSIPADALDALGPQLLQACVREYQNPAHLEPGELRPIKKTNPDNGQTFIDWIGRESFVRAMSRPGRKVTQFVTDHGRYNVAKARYE